MKKVLFWLLFPLTCLFFILGTIMEGFGERLVEFCHLWEKWCCGVPEGMEYIGGVWYKGVDSHKKGTQ